MSDVVPFPTERACPQQIGQSVNDLDSKLRASVLDILREGRNAGGDAVVGSLLARLIVSVGIEFGDAVLDELADGSSFSLRWAVRLLTRTNLMGLGRSPNLIGTA